MLATVKATVCGLSSTPAYDHGTKGWLFNTKGPLFPRKYNGKALPGNRALEWNHWKENITSCKLYFLLVGRDSKKKKFSLSNDFYTNYQAPFALVQKLLLRSLGVWDTQLVISCSVEEQQRWGFEVTLSYV